MDTPSSSDRRQCDHSKRLLGHAITFPRIFRSFSPEREKCIPATCTLHISTRIILRGEHLCSTSLRASIRSSHSTTKTRHITPVLQNVPTTGRTVGFWPSGGGEGEPAAETVRLAQGTPALLPVRRTIYDRSCFPYAIWPQCNSERRQRERECGR